MKKTFKAVRDGNIDAVREILSVNPDEINAVAKQPPKKDDGQSLLQVALKTGQLDIAMLLLDFNANVNYIEPEECCNEWRVPVLHDAIRCAIMNCRWNSKDYFTKKYEVHSTKEKADKAFCVLKRMLELGADITSKDSFGNTSLERAILDARQLLPSYTYPEMTVGDDRLITDELRNDFSRIFSLLYEYGASNQWMDRITGQSIAEHYKDEPVSEFLKATNLPVSKKSVFSKFFKK